MAALKTIESKNYKFEVHQDGDVECPREWENLTQMIFFDNYSRLGDKHQLTSEKSIESQLKGVVFIKPVYAYIHGGMTISLKPFNCRWDSGQLGWVVVTKEDLRRTYGVKYVTQKFLKEKTKDIESSIEAEIKLLNQYIAGDTYYFTVTEKSTGEIVDSYGGYYGFDIKAMAECVEIDEVREAIKEHIILRSI